MTTAIATWDPNSGAALPAHIAAALGGGGFETNIPDRNTVPSLSYEGKTWTIVKDGNKTKLQMQNSDGDMVPVPVMRCIILNFNADRGRAFYEGTYDPSKATAPKCWSPDGKAPDASVKEKQSALCQGCPQSVKGSKIQDSKEMVACSSHRMIAIAPAFEINGDPLRLKIAVTSDYDKEIVEHGWFAFRQYSDFLKSRGITHTALVVTKIKFDSSVAFPKLLFALDRLVTAEELAQVQQALANPKVAELLSEKWTAAGVNGTPSNDSDIKPHGLEGAYLDGWQAHPDAAGYSWKGSEVKTNDEVAALYPAPTPPPVPAAAPPVPASQQVVEHPPVTATVAAAPPVAPEPITNAAPVVPAHDPLTAAMADGWAVHPANPAYYFKGNEVVATDDVIAKYPAPAAAAPAPTPPAPPAPPAAPAPIAVDPIQAAEADGWVKHPDAADYHYKGAEVVLTTELAGRYGGNGAASADTGAAQAGTTSGTTATAGASPSDGEIPADVQALLGKWGG